MPALTWMYGLRTTVIITLYIIASTIIALWNASTESALVVGAMGGGVAAIKWGNSRESKAEAAKE